MKGTLTIRLDARSFRAVRQNARKQRKTTSEYVRDLIARDAEQKPDAAPSAYDLTKKYIGRVRHGALVRGAAAREALEDWNPDRR